VPSGHSRNDSRHSHQHDGPPHGGPFGWAWPRKSWPVYNTSDLPEISRDVRQPRHAGIVASLRDDHPAVGVAYQNRRPVLPGQRSPHGEHVVRQRGRRILDHTHVEPLGAQQLVDALPTGAVHEPTMYQYDVLDVSRGPFQHDALPSSRYGLECTSRAHILRIRAREHNLTSCLVVHSLDA
jgi:hypothetical protein